MLLLERLHGRTAASLAGEAPPSRQLSPSELLARATFFSDVPNEVREELAAQLQRLEVKAGTAIVREGEEGHTYYLIAAGEVEVWGLKKPGKQAAPAGDELWQPNLQQHKLVACLGPGHGFGEMALLLGGTRRSTVVAATDMVLYSLDGDTFTSIVNRHRGLAVKLEEEMALRGVATFLGRASPFANLPPGALRWVAMHLHPVTFAAGADIVRQGEPGDAFYIVQSGRVEVLGRDPAGEEYRIAVLNPGEPFGEQALVTGEPRNATVRALEPVELLRLNRQDFAAVVQRHKERGSYFTQLTLQRQRPKRISHWRIESQSTRDGVVVHILKNTRHNRYVKLSEQGKFLWDLMDGQHTVRDLTMAYFAKYHVFGLDAVMGCMLQLNDAGFLEMQRVDARRMGLETELSAMQRLLLRLMPWVVHYISLPDVDPAVTWVYRYPVRLLFTPVGLVFLFSCAFVGAPVFLAQALHPAAGEAGASIANIVIVASVVSFIIQGFCHELGHAVTCKHFGREVHRAGIGWAFSFVPVAFVDTSDIWLAGKVARAAVAFAGPYTNFILSGAASLLMLITHSLPLHVALFQFAITGYLLGVVNLNPLAEFDGYYVLMDLLDIPNLRAKAIEFLGALLWRARLPVRNRRLQTIFLAYGILALGYTIFAGGSTFIAYHEYVATVVDRMLPALFSSLLGYAVSGLMACLILAKTWGDLRHGARKAARAHRGVAA